ncbi:MAG: glutamate--cysteine ligase [Acidimicrobiia bacterium]
MQIEFRSSERASLGIEVELTLVDSESGALVSAASEILEELGRDHPDGAHPKAKHELFECTIEVITGICQTVGEAKRDLAATIAEVRAAASTRGLTLVSSGSHPFSHPHEQIVSPDPRYFALVEEMQWPARRLQIFGIHYHVGVRSAEKSIVIANALQYYLAHLLALSSSSPYWEGHDTGLASCRVQVFEGLPTAGLPPVIDDWADFEQFMHTLVSAEAIKSIREVWWDVRPHPNFGTVELRICDAMPTLREVAAVGALVQCLVHRIDMRIDAGEPVYIPREWTIRQNKWLAARYGLDAKLIVDDEGTRSTARDAILELIEELAPVAVELGCRDELADVAHILDLGPSTTRQRRVVDRGGSLVDVVHALVEELETDVPGPR